MFNYCYGGKKGCFYITLRLTFIKIAIITVLAVIYGVLFFIPDYAHTVSSGTLENLLRAEMPLNTSRLISLFKKKNRLL